MELLFEIDVKNSGFEQLPAFSKPVCLVGALPHLLSTASMTKIKNSMVRFDVLSG
jgi:hypothetical protein